MAQTTKPYVLLVNLGSPERPETGPVRRYLRQFLSDRRVIETHPLLWRPILEGIILLVRPARSAAKYRLPWGNDRDAWLDALDQIVRDSLAGWIPAESASSTQA